jgi:heptosyltransferase-2
MKKQILIVGPGWVGDMVMAQSLFKLLKSRYRHVDIDVLAPAWSKAVLDRMPEVRDMIAMPVGHGELRLRARYDLAQSLREKNYDQAIALPNSFKSALIPAWAKIPVRTGWLGELRWGLLNDHRKLNNAQYPLMIERFMALGLPTGDPVPTPHFHPELAVSESNVQQLISQCGLDQSKPILVLCPGAAFGSAKRWPISHFIEVAKQKLKDGWSVWLWGSKKESTLCLPIMEATENRCVDLLDLPFGAAIDVMSKATVVVSNDSGAMHIACALKRPLVALYGPTDWKVTPPLSETAKILWHDVPCRPCGERECPLKHHQCMEDLAPGLVLKTIEELSCV